MARPKKFKDEDVEGLIIIENFILGKSLRQISEEWKISKSTLSLYRKKMVDEYGGMIKLRDKISKSGCREENNTLIGWKLEVLIRYMFERYGKNLPVTTLWTGQTKGVGVDVVVVFEKERKMLLIECKNWDEKTWKGMDVRKIQDQILSRFEFAENMYNIPSTPWENYEKIWVLVTSLKVPDNIKKHLEELTPSNKKIYLWGTPLETRRIEKEVGYSNHKSVLGLFFLSLFPDKGELERKLNDSDTLRRMKKRAYKDIREDMKKARTKSKNRKKNTKKRTKRKRH